jgi:hypothetical protein
MVRPIVRELMAEELERLEDRLDAQDAREALAEPGGITHEELVKKLGLYAPEGEEDLAAGRQVATLCEQRPPAPGCHRNRRMA